MTRAGSKPLGAPAPARTGKAKPATPDRPEHPPADGQAERQGFGRQRLEPQDHPPAGVLDDQNIAGEKDFELQPPPNGK